MIADSVRRLLIPYESFYFLGLLIPFKHMLLLGVEHGTMPAKSLGALAMIYAIGELQNPLPRKTMLCKGDMNNSASRSDAFLQR